MEHYQKSHKNQTEKKYSISFVLVACNQNKSEAEFLDCMLLLLFTLLLLLLVCTFLSLLIAKYVWNCARWHHKLPFSILIILLAWFFVSYDTLYNT